MFKRYYESLTKMEKINIGLTGLSVLAGLGLWIYGSIEEKKVLKEIQEFNDQVNEDMVKLGDIIYGSQEQLDELLNDKED